MRHGPLFRSGTGVSDNDVIIQLGSTGDNVSDFNTWLFQCVAGAADVTVSLDGTNWSNPVSLADLSAITSDPVIVMAAGKLYGIAGMHVKMLRVLQNGAVATTVAISASTNS